MSFFIGDYFQAYPAAKIYASPGLPEKRKDLKFRYILKDSPEIEWQAELDQIIFFGHPALQEVIFYHRPSRTLIVADLVMYFDEDSTFLTRWVARLWGMYKQPIPPMDFKVTLTQKMQVRLCLERILQWDFERVILAHGGLIEKEGKKTLQEAFAWVYENQGEKIRPVG